MEKAKARPKLKLLGPKLKAPEELEEEELVKTIEVIVSSSALGAD